MDYFKASVFVSGATVHMREHAELILGIEHDQRKHIFPMLDNCLSAVLTKLIFKW